MDAVNKLTGVQLPLFPELGLRPDNIIVITLWEHWTDCWVCGTPTIIRQGVPISMESGELVPNDFAGEWCGAHVCQSCFRRHAAGESLDPYYEKRKLRQIVAFAAQQHERSSITVFA